MIEEIKMRKISWAISLLTAMLMTSQISSATERVGNFALLDHKGIYHQLRKYGDSKAVVIISTATNCLENIEKLPKYRLLRTTWENQGVSFLAINSSVDDDLVDIRLMDSLHNVNLPILLDNSQLVAESLGLSKAGEIIVLEPNRSLVLYRGGLDIDARRARPDRGITAQSGTTDLAKTLAAAVMGELDSFDETVVTESVGCELDFPARDQHVSNVHDYET